MSWVRASGPVSAEGFCGGFQSDCCRRQQTAIDLRIGVEQWVGSTSSDLPQNPLRGLSVPVGDGKAHYVRAQLYATSRFTNYLPKISSQNGIGTYEEVSDHALDTWIWAPATSRPIRPVLDRILPVFDWEEGSSSESDVMHRRSTRRPANSTSISKIGSGASNRPLVQLGQCRYEPHSVQDQELSEPVALWCQLMPQRHGKVTFVNDTELVLSLNGVFARTCDRSR